MRKLYKSEFQEGQTNKQRYELESEKQIGPYKIDFYLKAHEQGEITFDFPDKIIDEQTLKKLPLILEVHGPHHFNTRNKLTDRTVIREKQLHRNYSLVDGEIVEQKSMIMALQLKTIQKEFRDMIYADLFKGGNSQALDRLKIHAHFRHLI